MGEKKMSKSDANSSSRIGLLDSPDLIKKKIKRAKTDSYIGLEFDNPDRPEAENLLTIYSILSGKSRERVDIEFSNIGWGKFKPLLTDLIISSLDPIQNRYNELFNDKAELKQVLKEGSLKAEEVAQSTLKRIQEKLGLFAK